MVFNFGAWDQGVDKSKAEFKAKRAENANLYADYIRQNPDSSVEQRAAFSQNLAGNSNFLKNAMPTRDVMMQNVSRRKTQVAAAAASRKRAELNSNIALAKNLAPVYSAGLLAGGEAQAMSSITELSGGVLPAAALPLVQQFGTAQAKQTFNASMQPKFDMWKTAGARPEDVKQWGTGVSEGAQPFLTEWISQATATMQGMGNSQYAAAMDQGVQLANDGDKVALDNFLSNLAKVNPHLANNPEKLNSVTRDLTAAFNVGLADKNKRLEAAVKTGVTAAANSFGSDYQSPEQAYQAVVAEGRKVDPNFELSTENKVEIDNAFNTYLEQLNKIQDFQEQAAVTEKAVANTDNQFNAFGGDNITAEKVAELYAQRLVPEDQKNRSDSLQRKTAELVLDVNEFANEYNVPLTEVGDNGTTFKALADAVSLAAMDFDGDITQVKNQVLRAEANRIMAQRAKNPSDLHAQAFQAALNGRTLEEVNKRGGTVEFKSAYAAKLRELTIKSIDVLEEVAYSPATIGDEIKKTADKASEVVKKALGPGAEGEDLFTNANKLIDEVYGGGPGTGSSANSPSLPEISSRSSDQAGRLTEAAKAISLAGRSLEERIRMATAQINREQFLAMPKEVQAVEQQINSMEKQKALLIEELNKIRKVHGEVVGQTMQFTTGAINADYTVDDLNAVADITVMNLKDYKQATPSQMERAIENAIEQSFSPITDAFRIREKNAIGKELKRIITERMSGSGSATFNTSFLNENKTNPDHLNRSGADPFGVFSPPRILP